MKSTLNFAENTIYDAKMYFILVFVKSFTDLYNYQICEIVRTIFNVKEYHSIVVDK